MQDAAPSGGKVKTPFGAAFSEHWENQLLVLIQLLFLESWNNLLDKECKSELKSREGQNFPRAGRINPFCVYVRFAFTTLNSEPVCGPKRRFWQFVLVSSSHSDQQQAFKGCSWKIFYNQITFINQDSFCHRKVRTNSDFSN